MKSEQEIRDKLERELDLLTRINSHVAPPSDEFNFIQITSAAKIHALKWVLDYPPIEHPDNHV